MSATILAKYPSNDCDKELEEKITLEPKEEIQYELLFYTDVGISKVRKEGILFTNQRLIAIRDGKILWSTKLTSLTNYGVLSDDKNLKLNFDTLEGPLEFLVGEGFIIQMDKHTIYDFISVLAEAAPLTGIDKWMDGLNITYPVIYEDGSKIFGGVMTDTPCIDSSSREMFYMDTINAEYSTAVYKTREKKEIACILKSVESDIVITSPDGKSIGRFNKQAGCTEELFMPQKMIFDAEGSYLGRITKERVLSKNLVMEYGGERVLRIAKSNGKMQAEKLKKMDEISKQEEILYLIIGAFWTKKGF